MSCKSCGKPSTYSPGTGCQNQKHILYYHKWWHQNLSRKNLRERAMQTLFTCYRVPQKCMVDGCSVTDIRILEINHLLNAPKLHGRELHRAIIHGRVDAIYFDVRCSNHNKLYEYEVGRDFVGTRYQ